MFRYALYQGEGYNPYNKGIEIDGEANWRRQRAEKHWPNNAISCVSNAHRLKKEFIIKCRKLSVTSAELLLTRK